MFWEIYSGGELPFDGLSPAQVAMAVVVEGLRLSRPIGCPNDVWSMAQRCWCVVLLFSVYLRALTTNDKRRHRLAKPAERPGLKLIIECVCAGVVVSSMTLR